MSPVAGEALASPLGAFLPAQRWFAGRGRRVASVRVGPPVPLDPGPPALVHVLADVVYADGAVERYQVPVGVGAAPPAGLAADRVIGPVADDLVAWDALADQRLTRVLLERMVAGADLAGLHFTVESHAAALLVGVDLGAARPLGAEQSNTSVVIDGRLILKVFRLLVAGVNPELELTEALTRHGFDAVAQPVGWVEHAGERPADPVTLAILQPFYAGSAEGWALAVERSTAWHDGDDGAGFGAEAYGLGQVTGRLHAALATALPTARPGPAEAAALAERRRDELAETVQLAPELAELLPAVRALLGSATPGDAPLQRIHGDYHLGQVLGILDGGPENTPGVARWLILDFEGEPARSLAQRRRPDSPLRDVAGMLRSFDYAAFQPLAAGGELVSDSAGERAAAWAHQAREAFLAGWQAAGGSGATNSLRTFELDKALYEVRYEARYRPSWLPVPLGGIRRLLAASPTPR
jgi:maltokinase